jgi:hypothetical protein
MNSGVQSRSRGVLWPLIFVAQVFAFGMTPVKVSAATPLASVTFTLDATVVLGSGNLTVSPQQIISYLPGGAATGVAISPAVPSGVAIIGYDYVSGAGLPYRIVFDTTVNLGGVTFTPRDVAQTDGTGGWSKAFDGAASGIPAGVMIDALAHDATGQMLFSLDAFAALPGGINADPRNVMRYASGAYSVAHVLSTMIPSGINLTGLERLSNGNLLIGLDTTASVGGITANDEDILEFNPVANTWELNFNGAYNDADFAPAAINALAATSALPQPPTLTRMTPGNGLMRISFNPPSSNGGTPITSYTASCSGIGVATRTANGTSSPITVTGLTNGVNYTCTVSATNIAGTGGASSGASKVVKPASIAPILNILLD